MCTRCSGVLFCCRCSTLARMYNHYWGRITKSMETDHCGVLLLWFPLCTLPSVRTLVCGGRRWCCCCRCRCRCYNIFSCSLSLSLSQLTLSALQHRLVCEWSGDRLECERVCELVTFTKSNLNVKIKRKRQGRFARQQPQQQQQQQHTHSIEAAWAVQLAICALSPLLNRIAQYVNAKMNLCFDEWANF